MGVLEEKGRGLSGDEVSRLFKKTKKTFEGLKEKGNEGKI